ncbi:MAG: HlyD family efflux transporter periplasmic adaptor subunit, partial [Candidatus Eisenbacteria bacterium]|nr:HlyD family efflux transporter periplasmic adaptor subunit [Candidatus Eisenbacteria bacterium]
LERVRQLAERGSATQQQLDDLVTQEHAARQRLTALEAGREAARAQIAQAQAALRLLEHSIDDGVLRAPHAGTILTTFVSEGELITAARAVLEMADLQHFWIKVYVPAEALGEIALDETARVYPGDQGEAPLTGRIAWIASEAEFTPKNVQTRDARADLVFAVKVELDNPDGRLKPGLPADVAWN